MNPVVYSLTGNDSFVIAGRILTNFADADNGTVEFPNDIANVKTGKNGNAIFAENNMGRQCDTNLRLIRGSPDDLFLNDLLTQQLADFAAFEVLDGQFIKRVGDGNGNITNDTYLLGGGIFIKQVPGKSNAEGDTEQSLSMYHLKFANSGRAQQ
jgi:hypothetical protein